MGCTVVLVVGCAGVRSEAPQKEEQGHTEATKEQEGTSSGAASSEEARCEGTRTFKKMFWGVFTTNDVPDCPKGGLLSGTDGRDHLDGKDGDDEIHGLGDKDDLIGGMGSDVLYGGPGKDSMSGGTTQYTPDSPVDRRHDVLHGGPGRDKIIDGGPGDDVIYGGDGNDRLLSGGDGEDVLYGGDGNDTISSGEPVDPDATADGSRDKIYCGEGRDRYAADKFDQVSSSCEKEWVPPRLPPPNPRDFISTPPNAGEHGAAHAPQ